MELQSNSSSEKMFGPLNFEDEKYCGMNNTETKCIICEDSFNLSVSLKIFLMHLFDAHNIVIEDVQTIQYLCEYIKYWREKFKVTPMEQIIPSVKVESADKKYFLLSTLLQEDKELRHKFKLQHALNIQEQERTDQSYIRACLFCRLNFEGTRHDFLQHLSSSHNLQLGNPQNLVFIDELIQQIENKLDSLQCIYCEKTFPDRNTLKEHMRKKLHKRINPQNKNYDKYYIVNYLEVGKTWEVIEKEEDKYALPRGVEDNDDEEYFDWNDLDDQITCLFCKCKETNINLLCLHMEAEHDFDFVKITQALDFYQRVKLVNYIRRQIYNNKCIYCNTASENEVRLKNHFIEEEHYKVPEISVFDQPEFYFPTFENDAFLYFIDDVED